MVGGITKTGMRKQIGDADPEADRSAVLFQFSPRQVPLLPSSSFLSPLFPTLPGVSFSPHFSRPVPLDDFPTTAYGVGVISQRNAPMTLRNRNRYYEFSYFYP